MTKKAFTLGVSALLLTAFSLRASLYLARSHEATSQASAFVKVCGTQLCIGNVPYYPYGASFYGAATPSGIDNPQGLIALAQLEKLNAIRLVSFFPADANTDPNVTPYDPTTWAKVDALLVAAANANMKVILDNAGYKDILWKHCINPWTYNWHPYLAFVANRINDMTGQAYINDPTIFLVSFAGDVRKVPATYTFVDANGANCSISLTADMYTTFYADVESYWKTLDPNHLVSPGGIGGMEYAGQNGIPWQAIFSNPATDICGTKTYGGMPSFLPTLANYCNNTLHKPWFDDEWGYSQSEGDSVRAAKFQFQFDNNKANNAAGDFFWNAGYQLASTYDVGPQTPLTFNTVIRNAPQHPSVPSVTTIGIFRNGTFYLRLHNSTGTADLTVAYNPATKPYPVVGDWTGGGYDTVGVYDKSNGLFTLCTVNDTVGCGNTANRIQFVLGKPNDQPLSGRWQTTDIHDGGGVFRPSNGLIYLKDNLATGYADYTMVLGIPGDVGLAGDWGSVGHDSPGVYRPSNNVFYLNDQVCNCAEYATYTFQYGMAGDYPVTGDWTGQGHDGVGLFRQTNGFTYLRNALTTGFADLTFVYGIAGDIPVAGHWQLIYPAAPTPNPTSIVPTFVPVPIGGGPEN